MRRGERESHYFAVETGMYFNLSKPLVKGKICVLVFLCCYNKNNRLLYQQSKFIIYCSKIMRPRSKQTGQWKLTFRLLANISLSSQEGRHGHSVISFMRELISFIWDTNSQINAAKCLIHILVFWEPSAIHCQHLISMSSVRPGKTVLAWVSIAGLYPLSIDCYKP